MSTTSLARKGHLRPVSVDLDDAPSLLQQLQLAVARTRGRPAFPALKGFRLEWEKDVEPIYWHIRGIETRLGELIEMYGGLAA